MRLWIVWLALVSSVLSGSAAAAELDAAPDAKLEAKAAARATKALWIG